MSSSNISNYRDEYNKGPKKYSGLKEIVKMLSKSKTSRKNRQVIKNPGDFESQHKNDFNRDKDRDKDVISKMDSANNYIDNRVKRNNTSSVLKKVINPLLYSSFGRMPKEINAFADLSSHKNKNRSKKTLSGLRFGIQKTSKTYKPIGFLLEQKRKSIEASKSKNQDEKSK